MPLTALLLLTLAPFAEAAAPPATATTAPAMMWDLTDLYPTAAAWTAAYEKVRAEIPDLTSLRGTLGAGPDALFQAVDRMSAVTRDTYRLYVYASLKADEDLRVAADQERRQQVQALATQLEEATAWVAPEVLAVGEDRIRAFIAERPELRRRFDHYLDNILRAAPHTLGDEGEGLLAAAGTMLGQPNNVYDQIADADMPYPQVTLAEGTSVRLNQAAYARYRESADREERKRVFDAFWSTWKEFEGTVGAVLYSQLQGQAFRAKARRHESALAAALFANNMPDAVYRQLITQVNASLPVLHRYLRLRKRMLGITDDLGYHDVYPPIFSLPTEPRFSVADAQRITLAALAPMGESYIAKLRTGFAGNWMNALPTEGKASGAYMNGNAYDVHPYLLLNHNDNFSSLSTFAHEWGHAVHSLLANEAQPFEKADYATFTAESASIGNEMLLSDYMVRTAKTPQEKMYYLGEALESIRGTYFRQAQFAEFELAVNEEIGKGNPLSGARMTEMYCGILRRYYGEAEGVIRIDPTYCVEWAFIPHFYRNFYVYQYATSMAGAALFTDAILKEGGRARERFLDLLRAGGSGYPYELYRTAGIDMATPAPYQALAARMNRIMDEIEALERTGVRPAGGSAAGR